MTHYSTSGGVVFDNLTMEEVDFIDRLVKTTKLIDWYDIASIASQHDEPTLKAIAFLVSQPDNLNFYIDEIEQDMLIEGTNFSFALCWTKNKYVTIHGNDYAYLYLWLDRAIYMWYPKAVARVWHDSSENNSQIACSTEKQAKEVHAYIHAIAQVAACADIRELAGSEQVAELAWELAGHDQYVNLGIVNEDGDSIILFDDDRFDAEYVTTLVQAILTVLDSDEIVGYEWASTNSKWPWQHGGGACVVSKDDFEFMSSGYFASITGQDLLRLKRKSLGESK